MLPPQDGRLMSQGNELKFQRGTAAKTEFEDRNKGPKDRHPVTVRPACENLQPYLSLVEF
jgi:hypothetical protein